ncbi:unnamed protein product [Rhizoctonia solani]|uniref:Uncharacterized protein n=1 Tax=Rhizoctonia solani TaxID=456999 RepID=A0A8H2XM12_9AGAM|nr:unnamed protein product [Rhizoctonia solani]
MRKGGNLVRVGPTPPLQKKWFATAVSFRAFDGWIIKQAHMIA